MVLGFKRWQSKWAGAESFSPSADACTRENPWKGALSESRSWRSKALPGLEKVWMLGQWMAVRGRRGCLIGFIVLSQHVSSSQKFLLGTKC